MDDMTDEKQKFLAERSLDRMHLECGRIVMNWIHTVARIKDAVNLQEWYLGMSRTEWINQQGRQIDGRELFRNFQTRCEELKLNKFPEYDALIECLARGREDRDNLMHRLGVVSRKKILAKLAGSGYRGYLLRRKGAIMQRRMIRKNKNNIDKAYRISVEFVKYAAISNSTFIP